VASFTLNTYSVTPSAGANGTISPSTVQTIAHGATATFTVTPNAGYVASVGGSCGGTLTGNLYTTNTVTAACTVSAVFNAAALTPQTITFSLPATLATNSSPLTASASASSGLAVLFTSLTPAICTTSGINGATISVTGVVGLCTIRASQAGNASYAAAADVDRSIAVSASSSVAAPPHLACTTPVTGTISCRYDALASGGTPVVSVRLLCTATSGSSFQGAATGSAINGPIRLTGLPAGIYLCTATAQADGASSDASNASRVALKGKPLSMRNEFDADGSGFAEIYLRGSLPAPAGSDAATTTASMIGRYDASESRFVFAATADLGASWNLLGAGDLTGSNTSGLVSRDDNANVRFDPGLPPANGIVLRKALPDWTVEAVVDLDGDGKADILWRYIKPGTDDSGVVFAWYMGDGKPYDPAASAGDSATIAVNEIKRRGGAPLSWELIGAIDIDGDGRADLIWQSPANDLRALIGTAGRNWTNQLIGQVPAGYSVVRLGDVDGDGRGDMLFRDAAGHVKLWLMNGVAIQRAIDLPDIGAAWTFYAAGDFNGDGTMDIVWKKPDGTLVLWLIRADAVDQPAVVDAAGVAPTGLVVVEP